MAVLGYLLKLERGLVPAFDTIFCMIFSIKCSLFNTLSMDKVAMSYLFSFSKNQTKCVIDFLFRQLMISRTLRFIFDHRLKQWPTGRKRGRMEIQKFEYLENRKSFLDEIKSIFHSF